MLFRSTGTATTSVPPTSRVSTKRRARAVIFFGPGCCIPCLTDRKPRASGCARSGNTAGDSRSGYVTPCGLCWTPSIGTDWVAVGRCRAGVDEYSCHGKGRRERSLPLWKTTATALRAWLVIHGRVSAPELFVNAKAFNPVELKALSPRDGGCIAGGADARIKAAESRARRKASLPCGNVARNITAVMVRTQ